MESDWTSKHFDTVLDINEEEIQLKIKKQTNLSTSTEHSDWEMGLQMTNR